MSKLNVEEVAIAQNLINNKAGIYELKDIFRSKWVSIRSPTDYGSRFKETVEKKLLYNIVVGKKKTNNHQTYIIKGNMK